MTVTIGSEVALAGGATSAPDAQTTMASARDAANRPAPATATMRMTRDRVMRRSGDRSGRRSMSARPHAESIPLTINGWKSKDAATGHKSGLKPLQRLGVAM